MPILYYITAKQNSIDNLNVHMFVHIYMIIIIKLSYNVFSSIKNKN